MLLRLALGGRNDVVIASVRYHLRPEDGSGTLAPVGEAEALLKQVRSWRQAS